MNAVAAQWSENTSPRFIARAGGFFWLMTAVAGMFAMSGDRLVVWRNGATTAANLAAQEGLFRFANASNLIACVCYVAATVFVYVLLMPVNRIVSLTAAFFSLAGCSVSGVGFVFRLAPLVVLGSESIAAFGATQSQAMALTFLHLNADAFYISHVFFGLHCFLVGYLILRSTFLPRFLAVLMAIAGMGWLTMSFANLLSPVFARTLMPYIVAPGAIGEISLALWLLIAGVNVRHCSEQARETAATLEPEMRG
jgi:hypothetical protein